MPTSGGSAPATRVTVESAASKTRGQPCCPLWSQKGWLASQRCLLFSSRPFLDCQLQTDGPTASASNVASHSRKLRQLPYSPDRKPLAAGAVRRDCGALRCSVDGSTLRFDRFVHIDLRGRPGEHDHWGEARRCGIGSFSPSPGTDRRPLELGPSCHPSTASRAVSTHGFAEPGP